MKNISEKDRVAIMIKSGEEEKKARIYLGLKRFSYNKDIASTLFEYLKERGRINERMFAVFDSGAIGFMEADTEDQMKHSLHYLKNTKTKIINISEILGNKQILLDF